MEIDAGLLERKAAMIENAGNACRKVVDDVLVVDPKDAARKNPIPMLHEVEVGPVVTSDIFARIGELLALGEELFQVAEAACQRISPRIDDCSVGQH